MAPIYVLMDDEAQRVCPVEAESEAAARELLAAELGRDISGEPIYCTDSDDDVRMIISIISARP